MILIELVVSIMFLTFLTYNFFDRFIFELFRKLAIGSVGFVGANSVQGFSNLEKIRSKTSIRIGYISFSGGNSNGVKTISI